MGENAEERGNLGAGQWVTIYAGIEPRTFFVQLFGSTPGMARLEVEVNGNIEGALTQKNPNMHANGTKIRLHNVGMESQGYNYYPA